MHQYYPTSPAGSGPLTTLTRQGSYGSTSSTYSASIPSSVHTLIAAMKNLQSALTHWSISRASPDAVSDAYMQFGTGFNAAVSAFQGCGIDTTDLHQIPARLRAVLESCLGEDASPAALELYQPLIRQQLYELLQGLKAKQGYAGW